MRATPDQIINLCKQRDYVAVFMLAKGRPYALSAKALAELDNAYYYDVQVSGNSIELLVRQGQRKEIKPL